MFHINNMKLLIIEGPDRCGKNTLINNFTSQAENYIVRHWGTAKGETDIEKRNHQYQFFKKEFELASERYKYSMPDKKRYPRDIYIWNRAHLGEFVYGDLYRNTSPREWVLRMEEDFSFDIDPSIYLVLLTAPAEFLSRKDDGLSFSSKIENRQAEIRRFEVAFEQSKIMNKLLVNVAGPDANGKMDYFDTTGKKVFEQVNKFVFE
jgi:thymidylate kinase